jgi:hypothetical protein
MLVTEITRADVTKFHHDLRHIPYEANRCLEIISKMFNLAELWGLRPDGSNPRRLIQKYPEVKRERYLSMDEIGLVTVLRRSLISLCHLCFERQRADAAQICVTATGVVEPVDVLEDRGLCLSSC